MSDAEPALSAEDERDGRLRALAALENLRNQKNQEIAQARDQGEAYVATAFLEVVDDFERALKAMTMIAEVDADEVALNFKPTREIVEGLQLVFDKFGQVLARLEIEGFETEGQRFQAELMDAIAQSPQRALPPGVVSDQARKGYMRRGKLLRPAQVVVTVESDE